jgi:alpha-tubulin suppressor-like RCC1 family protein
LYWCQLIVARLYLKTEVDSMRSRTLFSRSARRLPAAFAAAIVLATLGCQEEAAPPTAPDESAPALAAAAAGALAFRQVSAGDRHTCGVTTDDQAYCWGLGGRLTPAPVSGGLRFLEVSAGVDKTCGVTTDLRAYCWETDLTPAEVPGGRRFRQVSVGLEYVCAVTPTDVAFCWGNNQFGQLGIGGGFGSDTPVRVAGGLRFRRVFTAASHTCGATTDNRAYCWGSNAFHALGDGSAVAEQPKPVAVIGGLRFRQVKPASALPAGLNPPEFDKALTCGVTTDDRAYCWGANGALGSEIERSSTPAAVAGGRHFNFVHPGRLHACALTLSDVAFCWGTNEYGQLGTGGGFSRTPVRVAGGLRFEGLTVATTGFHTCGVTADHRAYCWGANHAGQLGDGTRLSRPKPVAVAGLM